MRRRTAKKHIILPDPKYKDVEVTKFVNSLMIDGKKNIAFNIFYDSIDIVSEKTSENGLEIWKKAVENITPSVEVKSRRVGGATFQIPTPSTALNKNTKPSNTRKDLFTSTVKSTCPGVSLMLT